MAILFTRTVIVPAWLLTFALVFAFGTPSETLTRRLLVLGSGIVVVAIVLGRTSSDPAVSDGRRTIDLRPLDAAPVPRRLRPQRWSSRW